MIHIVVDPERPDPEAIDRAAGSLRDGGVVAIPTDTLYGLAADPFNAAAVARIFAIKGRQQDAPLPLVAADAMQVRLCLGEMSALGSRLADRFWPGPLTLVMHAPDSLADGVTDSRGTVGVRVPAHPVTRALCAAAGRPLTATSANISGQSATGDPVRVAESLGAALDALVDAGQTPGGPASTIVDVTGMEPRLIRAGAISWDDVHACANRA